MRRRLLVGVVLAFLAAAPPARGEDVDPVWPTEVRVEEKAATRLEILTLELEVLRLRLELVRRQLGDHAAERERVGRDAAKTAGLPWDLYDLDLIQRPLTWRLKKR